MRVSLITIDHQTGKTWWALWYAYPVVFSPARYLAHRLNFLYNNLWQKYNFKTQTPCSSTMAAAIIF